MDLKSKRILMAAIEERRELVQQLWFFGAEEEATGIYVGLRELRAKMKEVNVADTRRDNSGTNGDSTTE